MTDLIVKHTGTVTQYPGGHILIVCLDTFEPMLCRYKRNTVDD